MVYSGAGSKELAAYSSTPLPSLSLFLHLPLFIDIPSRTGLNCSIVLLLDNKPDLSILKLERYTLSDSMQVLNVTFWLLSAISSNLEAFLFRRIYLFIGYPVFFCWTRIY